MDPTLIRTYISAFGVFEIPRDVYLRSLRWKDSRSDYLNEWCQYQWEKSNA